MRIVQLIERACNYLLYINNATSTCNRMYISDPDEKKRIKRDRLSVEGLKTTFTDAADCFTGKRVAF